MSLDNKVVLVTGGASGIGRATVNRLALDGAHVVVADIQVDLAAEVVGEVKKAGGTAEVCELDVAKEGAAVAAVTAKVTAHGRLDAAFNNAGIPGRRSSCSTSTRWSGPAFLPSTSRAYLAVCKLRSRR